MATASVTNTLVTGTTITAAQHNTNYGDLVSFLNGSVVHVDGTKAFTAAQAMGGFKLTGLAAGSAAGDAVRFEQLPAAQTVLIPIRVLGDQVVGTDLILRLYMPFAGTFTEVFLYAGTAPTGADLEFDINLNGTTLWGVTQANRPIIVAAAQTESVTTFDTTSFADGDYLTLDCDQIGSTLPGSDIQGWLLVTKT